MGLFDGVIGNVLNSVVNNLATEAENPLLRSALGFLQEQGGVAGVVEKFQQGGLAQEAASWVSTGDNLPISAEQIQQVIGNGKIAEMAEKFGISSEDISAQLAQHLPNLIDKLTPNGSIPDATAI